MMETPATHHEQIHSRIKSTQHLSLHLKYSGDALFMGEHHEGLGAVPLMTA